MEDVADIYLSELVAAIEKVDRDALGAVVRATAGALLAGRRVLIAGNGGSGTSAIHMASDWSQAEGLQTPPVIIALNENVARLTALANDHGYEEVFARQVAAHGRPGDLLLVLSVSGDSPNIIRAAEEAQRSRLVVAAALGRLGRVGALADVAVVLGEGDYGLAEDLHLALAHIVVRVLDGGSPRTCEGTRNAPASVESGGLTRRLYTRNP